MLMIAADAAVVWVMLFSSAPNEFLPKRRALEKNMNANSAAVMPPPSMKPVLRPV